MVEGQYSPTKTTSDSNIDSPLDIQIPLTPRVSDNYVETHHYLIVPINNTSLQGPISKTSRTAPSDSSDSDNESTLNIHNALTQSLRHSGVYEEDTYSQAPLEDDKKKNPLREALLAKISRIKTPLKISQENFKAVTKQFKHILLQGSLERDTPGLQKLRTLCDKNGWSLFEFNYDASEMIPTTVHYFYKGSETSKLLPGTNFAEFADYENWDVKYQDGQEGKKGGLKLMNEKSLNYFFEAAYFKKYGKKAHLITVKAIVNDHRYCGISFILNME